MESSVDDSTQKAMIVLSILITFLVILTVVQIFFQIKEYQSTRHGEFEDARQMDRIDYLIGLLDEQERILKMKTAGRSEEYMEKEVERYVALHKEFTSQLEGLHEMMVGMSKKYDDELAMKGRKKTNLGLYSVEEDGTPSILRFCKILAMGEEGR